MPSRWASSLAAEGKENPADTIIIVNLSGRGDKDVETAAEWFDMLDENGNVKGTTLSTRKPKGPSERSNLEISTEEASSQDQN